MELIEDKKVSLDQLRQFLKSCLGDLNVVGKFSSCMDGVFGYEVSTSLLDSSNKNGLTGFQITVYAEDDFLDVETVESLLSKKRISFVNVSVYENDVRGPISIRYSNKKIK